jgi:putative hydrolase of the HAD superfamily
MPRLRAIFFDVDDTLYSTSAFARLARERGIDAMLRAGLRLTREDLARELDEVVAEFTSNYEHHYDKLLVRLPAAALAGVNPAVVVAAGVVAYHETKVKELAPYDDVLFALRRLSQTDLILGVITGGLAVKQAEKLIRLGVIRYLNPRAIFISDQVGFGKANPKLYARACQETGVDPREAMYVGDNPANDIDPPNQIGMITVRIRRDGKYAEVESRTPPTHEINDLGELLDLLKRTYTVNV